MKELLEHRCEAPSSLGAGISAEGMLAEGDAIGDAYEEDMRQEFGAMGMELPVEVRSRMNVFAVNEAFEEEIQALALPPEHRVKQCKDMIYHQLNKMDGIDSRELQAYIGLIVGQMEKNQLSALEKSPLGFAGKIKAKIESLLDGYCRERFDLWLETEKIICKPTYHLPQYITPTEYTATIGKSLYQAESGMDTLERELVMNVTALPNIRWWHRIVERHDFYINGFINHYPDIMICTQSEKIILAETKGEETPLEGAITMTRFLDILRGL